MENRKDNITYDLDVAKIHSKYFLERTGLLDLSLAWFSRWQSAWVLPYVNISSELRISLRSCLWTSIQEIRKIYEDLVITTIINAKVRYIFGWIRPLQKGSIKEFSWWFCTQMITKLPKHCWAFKYLKPSLLFCYFIMKSPVTPIVQIVHKPNII